MQYAAKTVEEYCSLLPEERKYAFLQLMACMRRGLPPGFVETLAYGVPAWVVPHSLYPDGYHVKPSEPLPFISAANQKNFIAVYHMGLLLADSVCHWFREAWDALNIGKLDMGKSCIRLKKINSLPYGLLEELAGKITVEEWIGLYESRVKNAR